MDKARAFVALSRPHFLLGGILLFALGASTSPQVSAADYLWAQLMVTAAQVTAHFVNEYADVAADRLVTNRTLFSGGSGVLPAGLLRPAVALRAAVVSSAIAMAAAGVVATSSLAAAGLGMAALTISWVYSIEPPRLLATGWGELATSLVVAGLVPAIGASATGGSITTYLGGAILVLLCLHMAMMLIFELPDLASDASAGKTVLAVRLGERRARRLVALLYGAGYLLLGGLSLAAPEPLGFVAAAFAVSPPLAVALWAARTGRSPWLTASAVATLVAAAVAFLLAAPMPPAS